MTITNSWFSFYQTITLSENFHHLIKSEVELMFFIEAHLGLTCWYLLGYIRMEEIDSMFLLPAPKPFNSNGPSEFWVKPRLCVRLERLQGGGQWGRVGCVIDLSARQVIR